MMQQRVPVSGTTVAILGIAVALLEGCMGSSRGSGLRQELSERLKQDGLQIGGCGWKELTAFPFAADPRRQLFTSDEGIGTVGFVPGGRSLILGIGFRRIRKVTVDGQVEWTIEAGDPMMSGAALRPSPDGRRIAYQETLEPMWPNIRPGFSGVPVRVRILTLGTPLVDEVLTGAPDFESELMGWSSDSQRIVMAIGGEVRIYELVTGKYRAIGRGTNPSWSPDGNTIAWVGVNQHGVLFDTRTGGTKEILGRETNAYGMKWSPDSKYLLACVKQLQLFGSTALVVVRASDGEYVKVLELALGITNRDYDWVLVPRSDFDAEPRLR